MRAYSVVISLTDIDMEQNQSRLTLRNLRGNIVRGRVMCRVAHDRREASRRAELERRAERIADLRGPTLRPGTGPPRFISIAPALEQSARGRGALLWPRRRAKRPPPADSRSRISEFLYPLVLHRRTRAGLFFLAIFAAPATRWPSRRSPASP